MTAPDLLALARLGGLGVLGGLAGGVLGVLFFGSLRWNTSAAALERPVRLALVQMARLLGLGAALVALAMGGAAPLLGATAGLLLARRRVIARATGGSGREEAWNRR